jgi:hypothetical protein
MAESVWEMSRKSEKTENDAKVKKLCRKSRKHGIGTQSPKKETKGRNT